MIGDVVPAFKDKDPDDVLREASERWVVGTPEEISKQIHAMAGLGVELVMLQHFLLDDSEALELLGREVVPAVA